MKLKKTLICGALTIGVITGNSIFSFAQNITYEVKPNDMFWKISQKYGISTLELMKANNATENTILYPGQILTIPLGNQTIHTVKSGETYWTISKKYGVDFQKVLSANNANENSILYVGDTVLIPSTNQKYESTTYTVQKGETYWTISKKFNVDFTELLKLNGANDKSYLNIGQVIKIPTNGTTSVTSSQSDITYKDYTVQKGDTLWIISEKYGVTINDLTKANNLNSSTILNIGQKLKIPVYNIPVKSTSGEKYGELLDWWTEAQYVIAKGCTFEVVDFYTGKSFNVKRTGGSNHADCETLTVKDTNIMKEIWGGFSWVRRPVIIKYNGRRIAAGMTSMPHAGNDSVQGGVWTSWRSGDYGAGTNYDYVKGNGIDGHFDIHFYNSTRHLDGEQDPNHQACIQIAAGKK